MTTTTSIGRNVDGKSMLFYEWQWFKSTLLSYAKFEGEVYFEGEGEGTYGGEHEQSYTVVHERRIPDHRLGPLVRMFRQESIAVTEGETRLLRGGLREVKSMNEPTEEEVKNRC